MVENTHTAGRLPNMLEPLRNLKDRIADWFAPASEASATEDKYHIELELAGVKAEDIEVSVDGNSLTVKGQKHSEHSEEGRNYFFSEREYGAFLRTFRLPADADTDAIKAECSDGVLKLQISKEAAKEETAKRIKIQQG